MLEIKGLTCGYGDDPIIYDINLKVGYNEICAIVGPNGSGKTTLLRAVTGALKPVSGDILIDGVEARSMTCKELSKKVAVVSQGNDVTNLTVEEFVLLGRIPHHSSFQFFETKQDVQTAEKYMTLTDTIKYRSHYIDKISGGEKQLAMIARALAQEPRLLLLDEPTSSLDITHQVNILDLVKTLNKELNITVVMVLHDLNLAAEYCDKLVMVNQGRIYKTGTPWEVLDYKNIEEVYKTIVVVKENPVSKKPHVVIVSKEARQLNEQNKG